MNSYYYVVKSYLKHFPFLYRLLRYAKSLLRRLKDALYWSTLVLYYELVNLFTRNVVFTRCWVLLRRYKLIPRNWGDDINKYFFEYVAHIRVATLPGGSMFFWGRAHYSLIGSILGHYPLRDCTVYGAGLMTALESVNIDHTPRKIISVRGPLTRKALLQHGIDCPENYGDPVLLLPLFYTPSSKKSYAVSIIPNIVTFRNPCPIVDALTEKYGCKLVDMTRYDKWTDIIDSIASSSFVISESLHGLIVAETYNIPCVWVEFINHEQRFNDDWSFKFRDFYESIGKPGMTSLKLYEGFSFDELMREKDKWQPGKIDYAKLLELFPFEIKPEFLPGIKKFLLNH